jgi:hypothetical protein
MSRVHAKVAVPARFTGLLGLGLLGLGLRGLGLQMTRNVNLVVKPLLLSQRSRR